MADFDPSLKNRVILTNKNVKNAFSIEDPSAFGDMKLNGTALENFTKNVKINIISETDEHIVFDIIGIDAPVANALRRIMLAEVPTMAVESVNMYQNTSIMQDEVLAHRLGLIPIKADPRLFSYVSEAKNQEMDQSNTLVFTLVKKCTKNPKSKDTTAPDKLYKNEEVLSGDLQWIPQGDQKQTLGDAVGVVHDDIIITKLRPGQVIEAELLCEKGIGKEHAKWSPVCTASYRLLPEIVLKEDFCGADAKKLKKTCPQGVFDIEDIGGTSKAYVKYPRNCSMCRECIRDEKNESKIRLSRVRDHFIFSVESVGQYNRAREIVVSALHVLKKKAVKLNQELEDLYKSNDEA
mmetsp:Transcript_12738/g.23129  ORF Transcript_12738/g.23129 Transcript_12738/m.23129 type:complete len:350 (-) Transcript_12738:13-1062(-)